MTTGIVSTAGRVILPKAGFATAAATGFLAIADSTDQPEILLATITLRAKGAAPGVTMRVSDREFTDADGNRFDALITEKSVLDAGGDFLESNFQPPDYDLVVADGRLNFQTAGRTASAILYQYDLVGSSVTVQLGAEGLATADYLTIFEGEVAQVEDVTPTEFRLHCVQDRKWIRPVPTRAVEKNTYPDAPTDSVGLPVQLFYGNLSAGRVILNQLPSGANKAAYLAGVARAPIPMIPIGSGADGNTPQFIVTSGGITGTALEYILVQNEQTGRLAGSTFCTVATDANGNDILTLTGADFSKFDVAVLGTAANASSTADNWQEPVREDKDYTLSGYAQLDFDANKKILQIDLPDISASGTFVEAKVLLWYTKNASTTHPRFGVVNTVSGNEFTDLGAGASSTYASDTPKDYATTAALTKCAAWTDIKNCSLYAEVREAGGLLRVHRIVLRVTHRPAKGVIRPGYEQQYSKQSYTATGRKNRNYTAHTRYFGGVGTRTVPDVLGWSMPAFTYQQGVPDDGSGTYTGTPDICIEHPCDIVHHLLRTCGGLVAANVTTAASTFGSFADARTTLSGYKAQVYIGEATDVEDVVAEIGRQFLIWFYRRHHAANSPWVAIPWGAASAADYRSASDIFQFTPSYVSDVPRVGMSLVSEVRNIVRVNYDYDLRTRTYAEQCFITDTDSRGYSGGSEVRDMAATRELTAASSVSLYGRREHVINLSMCNDPATATSIRNRAFDLLSRPRVTLRFRTFLNACDLERGKVIQFSDDWDSILPYPGPGSDGSWYGKLFQVLRTTRREGNATTYDVEAIEA